MDASTEEDTELRDLVVQSLENDGTLGKIRATLRASIFLTLEQHDALNKRHPLHSKKLSDYLDTREGQIATALVREYLEHFNLLYTLSVFDPETNVKETANREKLFKSLDVEPSQSFPVLSTLLRKVGSPSSHKNNSFGKNETLTTPSFSLSIDASAEAAHSSTTKTNQSHNGKSTEKSNENSQSMETSEPLKDVKNDVASITNTGPPVDQVAVADDAFHNEGNILPQERQAFEEALNDSFIGNHDDFFDDIESDIPNFRDLKSPPLTANTSVPGSKTSDLHLLGDLPPIGRTLPLVEQHVPISSENVELNSKRQDDNENSLEKTDMKINELGFGENLYDEDFSPLSTSISQSSRSQKSHSKSEKSARTASARLNSKSRSESEASTSACSQSKKSKSESKSSKATKAKSSAKQAMASIEIEEEIAEEIDELDDLLNSDMGMDDFTTDKTISHHSGAENADYMEDLAMD